MNSKQVPPPPQPPEKNTHAHARTHARTHAHRHTHTHTHTHTQRGEVAYGRGTDRQIYHVDKPKSRRTDRWRDGRATRQV